MAAALICGTVMFTSCKDDNVVEALTAEKLVGLWVTDYAESGSNGELSWTRVVEAYRFNDDGTGYYESYQLDGNRLVMVKSVRDIGAGMRLYTYSPSVGYVENVNTAGNQWWDFVHQRPQVAFDVCDHEGWAVCPLCYPYTIQLK